MRSIHFLCSVQRSFVWKSISCSQFLCITKLFSVTISRITVFNAETHLHPPTRTQPTNCFCVQKLCSFTKRAFELCRCDMMNSILIQLHDSFHFVWNLVQGNFLNLSVKENSHSFYLSFTFSLWESLSHTHFFPQFHTSLIFQTINFQLNEQKSFSNKY